MSKLGCICWHTIREDEDTQKPIELLADLLTRYFEARQDGRGVEFVAKYEHGRGEAWLVDFLKDKPLPEVLYSRIFPFWTDYDRHIYECEDSGRLWVEVDGNCFVSYLPASDERHVLWSRNNHSPYGYLDE